MQTPDVFDYGDFRRYLSDWFEAAQRRNPRLSHRWFASRIGTENPSVLANVLAGRRALAPSRVADFCRVLELDGIEAEYFRALVEFGQAEDRAAADRAWATLAELRQRTRPAATLDETFEFQQCWWIPAIHELVRMRGFVEDPAWIAARMDPPITPEQAAEGLEICLRLGFVVRGDDGRLRTAEATVRTPDTVRRLATWPYLRDGVDLAARGLQRMVTGGVPGLSQETAFLAATMAVPASRIPEIRRSMFEMLARVNAAAEPWAGEADRVVHLTLAMVPVARVDAAAPPEPGGS